MASSVLLLEEYFKSGDERFLSELVSFSDTGPLKKLAAEWATDSRPFAREALTEYALRAPSLTGHRFLLKRLFKKAEAAQDDELMGVFLVAFDGFALREWGSGLRFDSSIPAHAPLDRNGKRSWPRNAWKDRGIFSRTTRRYLQRRAWRYFRHLGFRDPARYRSAVLRLLPRYTESSLNDVPRLMDSWGLLHILYGESDVLEFHPTAADVRTGRELKNLSPAPAFGDVWKTNAFPALLDLFLTARANPVRTWALSVIRRDYVDTLRDVPMELIRRLLRHDMVDVQALGLELLGSASGLDRLPITEWLGFLRLEQPAIMAKVVEVLRRHVSPDRLELTHCVELALSPVAPVAELGLSWARAKRVPNGALDMLMPLVNAKVASVRAEATSWLIQLINLHETAGLENNVRELIDSPHADVRVAALELMSKDRRFGDSVALWSAMTESPWADVREAMAPVIGKHLASFSTDQLKTVWASTLLAIHRGGRAKRQVVTQLATRIATNPPEAPQLLPILAHSLRSVRAPERRSALAALARACFQTPSLAEAVTRTIPELRFVGEEVAS